jgi:hypothetical protein
MHMADDKKPESQAKVEPPKGTAPEEAPPPPPPRSCQHTQAELDKALEEYKRAHPQADV